MKKKVRKIKQKNSEQLFNVFFPLSVNKNEAYHFVELMRNRGHECGILPDNPLVVQVRCSEKELKEVCEYYSVQSIDVLTKTQNNLRKGGKGGKDGNAHEKEK